MRPTDEQAAALDLFLAGDDMVIDAGAGTGKTSTLRMLASSTRRRGRYLVFSKALADEVAGTMPDRCPSSTAHSLAFQRAAGPYRHRMNGARMPGWQTAKILGLDPYVVRTDAGYKRLESGWLAGHVLRALRSFCQSAAREPSWLDFAYVDGIDLPAPNGARTFDNNHALAHHLEGALGKAWQDIQNPRGELRFGHEHYLKIFQLSDPKIPADYILFDEAQDANPVLAALVDAQDAQKVYVGDAQQAIYRFTGAVDAMEGFEAEHRRALTLSWRFGQEIADEANMILDMLDTTMRLRGNPDRVSAVGRMASPPDAILCRTNAGALRRVLAAQARGIPVHLVGGATDVASFAKGAKELIEGRRTGHFELACFDSWTEVQDYVRDDPNGSDLALLVRLIDEFTVETILRAIDGTVPDKPGVLVVSTVHKAKGREWDHVRIAGDMLDPPESDDELRLRYVAFTRARTMLDQSVFRGGTDDLDEEGLAVV